MELAERARAQAEAVSSSAPSPRAIERLEGACLCAGVRFRASGPWLRFVHCHCSRCRRATGSSHATNLFAAPGSLEWLVGESLVERFDLRSAASFASCFCAVCGSPLPHLTRGGSAWVIPAGSLDGAPAIRPSARIHWSSRASWSGSEEELTRFPDADDRLPEENDTEDCVWPSL